MKLQLAVLLISVLMRESIAMPAVDHCLTRFEESLKETMALRRSCEEASLKDCCQVRYYYPLLRVCSMGLLARVIINLLLHECTILLIANHFVMQFSCSFSKKCCRGRYSNGQLLVRM